MNALVKSLRVAGLAALLTLVPLTAGATVQKEGSWPASDKNVSFEFDGKPNDGLKKLADEAGWSLVLSSSVARTDEDVHIHVEDQPADAVLDALFAQSNVIAKRTGTLITVVPAGSAAATPTPTEAPAATAPAAAPAPSAAPAPPPPPPVPAAPPVPTVRGEDRNVLGSSVHISKGEIVHTVTVTGGSARVEGTVTGDLVVAGGSAHVEPGARVVGNVSVIGGALHLEKGARIDGDVGVVGGSIHREEGSFIGGSVVDSAHDQPGNVHVKLHDGEVTTDVKAEPAASKISKAAHSFGQTMTKMALLFVFGCVLLALATRRMDKLRVEAAARPMRSFALGIVGTIAALFVFVVACITVVGIPFAILALLLLILAVYGSIAAVLTTVGAAALQHKTESPYVHLLFGCAVFLVLLAIPYISGITAFVVTMVAIGSLVATRGAGLLDRRMRAHAN
jgi:hypothetical protein